MVEIAPSAIAGLHPNTIRGSLNAAPQLAPGPTASAPSTSNSYREASIILRD